ncbi:MAG: hypothetical protein WD942_03840 [Dehalococcoidia bacterium]
MDTKIYFPLRSNAGWFTSEQTRGLLERRIKNAMVLYDQLLFQDGLYKWVVLEKGQFDFYMGPDANPGDRGELSAFVPGRPAGLRMRSSKTGEYLPILEGPAVAGFNVDFFPILHQAGVLSTSYVTLATHELRDEVKADLKKQQSADGKCQDLLNVLPGNEFQKRKVIESAYHDSTLAHALRLPFVADPHVAGFVEWKNGVIGTRIQ